MKENRMHYLQVLSQQYPTITSASTEIINLQSILNLPKGTEHFLTDIHGEYEQFNHVLKNGSGTIRRKIEEVFKNQLSTQDKSLLATLVYYPAEKLELVLKEEIDIDEWYKITLHRLVELTKTVSSKYTRSKVRKALPKEFAYIMEELITEKAEVQDKEAYYNEIIKTIVQIGRASEFIIALCNLIQRLVIDHLHIVGDVFDRGPGPHVILDILSEYHSVDVQWGNHDVVWMGAASGHEACIANVIRMLAKYGNLSTLEEGYGINLIPLATFALQTYTDVDCECFTIDKDNTLSKNELNLDVKMYKAISMIQFKLEGQIMKRKPEFEMENRLLLDKINYEQKKIVIDGKTYNMKDVDFPTVNRKNPYKLTQEETDIMNRLKRAFMRCEKLQRHIRFLFTKGGLYKVYNSNLLYHGCVPLESNGEVSKIKFGGKEYSGKNMYDFLEYHARRGYYGKADSTERKRGQDVLWYIWTGPKSPVFGKDKMTTFERLFIDDKAAHKEIKNTYYKLLNNEDTVNKILKEFGLNCKGSHIINGHVPVEQINGETPIKCNGKLLIIDGGFSKAYHSKTGIAGYTLISNSHGMRLVSHEKFETTALAIEKETDIISDSVIVENFSKRKNVADTDIGMQLKNSITDLELLLSAYREGTIMEKLN